MDYIEVSCLHREGTEHNEIIIAYLASLGYSMFEETEEGVKAYIQPVEFNREQLNEIFTNGPLSGMHTKYEVREIPSVNWNEEWEKNFQPVTAGNRVYVRAEYHDPNPEIEYELVIQPRMAFGTGHHATTTLMMETMLNLDFKNKTVLDMGCGTGILAILAMKLGAENALAVDIDPNSTENTAVNMIRNEVRDIEIIAGGASSTGDRKFDVILANINRNIILTDLPLYVNNLSESGLLVTSGYYETDLPVIASKAAEYNLKEIAKSEKDNWCCAIFSKK